MEVFKSYANYYDLLYEDKNYEEECDFIEDALKQYSGIKAGNILELGSGTGGHAIPLAKRKYEMTGIDASEGMLKKAREKAGKLGLNMNLQLCDIRNFEFGRSFDAVICMFAVFNYITQTSDIVKTLKNVKKHLKKGGLFIIDIWNGLAVMRILPSTRVKVIERGTTKIIRAVEPELDAVNHLCRNHYTMLVLEKDRVIEEIKETHVMRFLFPQEIKHYLEQSGFEVMKMCPFPRMDGLVNENIWNIAVISKG
ncbi:MAG: methyltransferase domain-containing protein [Sedimentisphaerales bacterium]|nr:methyltransferase domain-containing protein [Sedimentisphaerales bacterium]